MKKKWNTFFLFIFRQLVCLCESPYNLFFSHENYCFSLAIKGNELIAPCREQWLGFGHSYDPKNDCNPDKIIDSVDKSVAHRTNREQLKIDLTNIRIYQNLLNAL